MANKNELFQSLFKSFVKANPQKKKKDIQEKTVTIWNGIKNSDDVSEKVRNIIRENEALFLKRKGNLLSFWGDSTTVKNVTRKASTPIITQPTIPLATPVPETTTSATPSTSKEEQPKQSVIIKQAPRKAQDEIRSKIDLINCDLVGLYKRKETGQLTDEQRQNVKQLENTKKDLERDLKRKIGDQERQKNARLKRKRTMDEILEKNPEIRQTFKKRDKVGRPRLEDDQTDLLKTIVDIAIHGSASHERRNEDILRSIKTLDELLVEIQRMGFEISRSGLYLRLLPKRSLSAEGKRHVVTVPVKLIKAQNDAHKHHIDEYFCKATINNLEVLASLLGPKEVCFLSQDDKARVPLGLTAANTQAPILMHVEYRVKLPDHDWVVAAKHKLIPSVYAGIVIDENGNGDPKAVGYSGPTYIAIRSGKHSSSTAYSHALDFESILEIPEFDDITKYKDEIKPIVIMTVDGGPDENPRYQKVIEVGIHHFVKCNLDAIFIATNAPGRSAFNRVERRMAPLSRELSGVILSHTVFGSHLDAKGNTTDSNLEKKNFEHCGNCLAEIWNGIVIDKFTTISKYVCPEKSELDQNNLKTRDAVWFSEHVRTSQYFTQIVKCQNEDCCSKPRSSLFKVLQDRFLPPPVPLEQTDDGIKASVTANKPSPSAKFPLLFILKSLNLKDLLPPDYIKNFKILPYDLYCPSIQSSLKDRVCKYCGLYFSSVTILKRHHTMHNKHSAEVTNSMKVRPVRIAARRQRELMAILINEENEEHDVEWIPEEDVDFNEVEDHVEQISGDRMPVISIAKYFESPWVEESEKK